jgi:uncharacterized protein YwqG
MTKLLIEDEAGSATATIGGRPLGPPDLTWPRCRACGGAMQFLAQLPIGESDEPGLHRSDECLLLFQCQNSPGMCDEWDAESGGNAAIRVPERGRSPLAIPEGDTLLGGESRLRFRQYEPIHGETSDDAYCAALDEAGSHVVGKIGGVPVWVQGDETPVCKCGSAMTFVCQLEAHGGGGINFGDAGSGYAFACSKCAGSARFLWQCR